MNIENFAEEIRESIRRVFNDTEKPVSETKRALQEIRMELDDISGDIEIMIDTLPD